MLAREAYRIFEQNGAEFFGKNLRYIVDKALKDKNKEINHLLDIKQFVKDLKSLPV